MRAILAVMSIALACFASAAASTDARSAYSVARLELGGQGFCTAALIAPSLAITAAHCLFDPKSGVLLPSGDLKLVFQGKAGNAQTHRRVRRVIVHPDYAVEDRIANRARYDIALLEMLDPFAPRHIAPFGLAKNPESGAVVRIISHRPQSDSPLPTISTCPILVSHQGVLVTACPVAFGASGAPVLADIAGRPHVISIISVKADMQSAPVSLGPILQNTLPQLLSTLEVEHSSSSPAVHVTCSSC
ncbi:MAG: trypsin-like serine protease [Pseudomonadota bacterium]